MALAFPRIRPSSRTFTKGAYPVKRQTSPAGTGVSRRFGTSPIGPTLSLEFANITDEDAHLIAKIYDDASGGYETITLPSELWTDILQPLRNNLKFRYYWRFSQPPAFSKSSIPGYKSVAVELIGDYTVVTLPDGLDYFPPFTPEPGPGSPTQIDSTGLKQVRLNWTAEEYGLSVFYSSGTVVMSWYGALTIEHSSVITIDTPYGAWLWISDDPRDPYPVLTQSPYSGLYLARSGPKVFTYAPV